jgi:sec-independent protein translocase protein TatA
MIMESITSLTTLAFGMPGTTEMIIILVLGLLIFGRRLPEVGRSLGKGIVEFKKGIKGIEDDIEDSSSSSANLPDSSAAQLEPGQGGSMSQAGEPAEAANPYAAGGASGESGAKS